MLSVLHCNFKFQRYEALKMGWDILDILYILPWETLVQNMDPRWLQKCYFAEGCSSVFPLRFLSLGQFYQIWQNWRGSCTKIIRHGSQIRLQLSAASPTNRPQPKVIITIVIIKFKLWPAVGCEAKVAAELSSRPLASADNWLNC